MSEVTDMESLRRRLDNIVRLGKIEQVWPEQYRASVDIGWSTGPLPWATLAGASASWDCPDVGEQVLVLSPGGEPAAGVILRGIFSHDFPVPESSGQIVSSIYKNGDTIRHDSATGDWQSTISGSQLTQIGADLEVNVSGDIRQTAGSKITMKVGGGAKGVVQGDCICPFTGAPHIQVSETVEASP